MDNTNRVGKLVLELEAHAKRLNLLPGAATLFYSAGSGRTPARIDVFYGAKRVALFDGHNFIPEFPPGMKKMDIEFVLRCMNDLLKALPENGRAYERKAVSWDGEAKIPSER